MKAGTSPLRVLYVEDNPLDADLARRALALQASGTTEIELDVAPTLAAARDRMGPTAAAYDVVLADLRLSDGDGLELLAEVRARGLPTAVVILTGSGDQASAIAALKAGADDYLVKQHGYREHLAPALRAAHARFLAEQARRARPLRVLYAEHNATDIDLTRRHFLQHAPHLRVDAVASGEDVLAALATPTDYDVVLLDYQLPGASGIDILKTLRDERGLDLPIILVSARGNEDVVAESLRLGVSDYLVKRGDYLATLPAAIEHAHRNVQMLREREALRQASERLARLLAASPTVIYALRVEDGNLRPTWVSDNVERMLGYRVKDCLAPEWWFSSLPDDERAELPARLARLFAEGQLTHEFRLRDRASATHWIRDEMRLLRDADGQASEVVGSWHDITAEHQRDERDRLHAAALAGTRDSVIIADLAARILAVNPAFTAISGYQEHEVLGQNPRLLHSGRQGRAFYQAMWASLLQTGHWQGEVWNRRKSGELYPQWLTISAVKDGNGRTTHYVGVGTDLSKLRHSEERVDHLAHYDPLTELPNRLLLQSLLQHALERASRSGTPVGVLSIGLDQFKTVIDSLGYEISDQLLVAVARRLGDRLRSEDVLGRVGGDEFALVLGDINHADDIETIARDLLAILDQGFVLPDGHETFVRASIGVAVSPQDGNTAPMLLHRSDSAMHQAKEQGGGQFAFYTGELNVQALARLELDTALRRALAQNEFELHYQPKVDLSSGRVVGAEALLRWRRPGGGLVSPLQFIPLAERSGLIVSIGSWVINEACRQLRVWDQDGPAELEVAVNVSARQFRSGGLEDVVAEALRQHEIRPHRLKLELTESMLMELADEAVARLAGLKSLGIRLALDDFGTGYSSLAYLGRFPMDELKIDRSFVVDIVTEPGAANIARSVIALAHRMGLRVVAEGVETEAQLNYLRQNDCDEMQGFYFSRPLPADEFAELLRQGKALPGQKTPEAQRTLLAVDDEPHILAALHRVLRRDGYRILTAASAREGLDILASNRVQVILSDQRMPEMSGTEFLGRVKILHPDTVRIVLSGYTDLDSIMRAVNEGSLYKFLTKPWDDEQLREHIRDAFRYHAAVIVKNGEGRTAT